MNKSKRNFDRLIVSVANMSGTMSKNDRRTLQIVEEELILTPVKF